MNAPVPVPERPVCRCGLKMTAAASHQADGIFFCSNCDVLQPQQLLNPPQERILTPEDRRFNDAMKAVIKDIKDSKGGSA